MPKGASDLAEERARRWWQRGRPVRSIDRAAAFVGDVGFALLFAKRERPMPSLYEATADRAAGEGGAFADGWGPDAERVWVWKDELPRRGLAWYGRFVRGRPSFVSPDLLGDLYPRSGDPDDFRDAPLRADAIRIAETILLNGPTSAAVLREATGAFGPKGRGRFDAAVTELGRRLVVTSLGTEDQEAGWPSTILELTARAFDVGSRTGAGTDRPAAQLRAARSFLDTMILARPHELGNAFGWGAAAARDALEGLVDLGDAVRLDRSYRIR